MDYDFRPIVIVISERFSQRSSFTSMKCLMKKRYRNHTNTSKRGNGVPVILFIDGIDGTFSQWLRKITAIYITTIRLPTVEIVQFRLTPLLSFEKAPNLMRVFLGRISIWRKEICVEMIWRLLKNEAMTIKALRINRLKIF